MLIGLCPEPRNRCAQQQVLGQAVVRRMNSIMDRMETLLAE